MGFYGGFHGCNGGSNGEMMVFNGKGYNGELMALTLMVRVIT